MFCIQILSYSQAATAVVANEIDVAAVLRASNVRRNEDGAMPLEYCW